MFPSNAWIRHRPKLFYGLKGLHIPAFGKPQNTMSLGLFSIRMPPPIDFGGVVQDVLF